MSVVLSIAAKGPGLTMKTVCFDTSLCFTNRFALLRTLKSQVTNFAIVMRPLSSCGHAVQAGLPVRDFGARAKCLLTPLANIC